MQKTIPLQDVTDVRKAKTAAIFPNAIEIVAGAKRVRKISLPKFLVYIRCHSLMYDYLQHFFGSFLARDEAYRIIVDGWEQHVSDARLLIERQVGKLVSIKFFCSNKL